jgi:hypothetical protein
VRTRAGTNPRPGVARVAGRECHHCKAWIAEGEAHDCSTTTEAVLTVDLPEDLRDAWERLRGTAASFGEQAHLRVGHSHHLLSKILLFSSCGRGKAPWRCECSSAARCLS